MKSLDRNIIIILFLASTTPTSTEANENSHALIESESLRAVIADNSAYGKDHRQGYSGISELYHGGSKRTLFVPAYSGLNLEHIFNGNYISYDWDIFEPRIAPITLSRLGNKRVELFQKRTANWPLQSRLIYEITNENTIEMRARFRPLEDTWEKHGYIGVFFASYIHAPEDMAIHFIGQTRSRKGNSLPRWITHLPKTHGDQACHRPAGSDWDPPIDPGFNISLVQGVSDYEYIHPFYFGISYGKVFIMMFKDFTGQGELRFAQSPSGGGKGNPAWDFFFLARNYKIGKDFGFTAATVYKDFTSREDVIKTWEKWSGDQVNRP